MQVSGKARKQLLEEINITPLTDVFLVLLIIMIVVAPMLKLTRTDIETPKVDGGDPVKAQKLVVEITREGVYFVDGKQTPETDLAAEFKAKIPEHKEKEMVIRADKDTKEINVIKVFDAAQEAEFTTMTVAVESLAPERQDLLDKKAKENPPS